MRFGFGLASSIFGGALPFFVFCLFFCLALLFLCLVACLFLYLITLSLSLSFVLRPLSSFFLSLFFAFVLVKLKTLTPKP